MFTRTELPNQPNSRSYHQELNEQLKRLFMFHGETPGSLTYIEPGRTITGKMASAKQAQKVELHKETVIKSSAANKVDAVYENGSFSRIMWTTTPENIRKAIRNGELSTPKAIANPLTQMIVQVGLYKRTTKERQEYGIISRIEKEKLQIVDHTQDCLEALQSLHTCINNYDENLSSQENIKWIQDALVKLNQGYTEQKDALITSMGTETNKEPEKTLIANLDQLIAKVNRYANSLQNLAASGSEDKIRAMLLPYGEVQPFAFLDKDDISLQHFLQSQLNTISKSAIDANDSIDWTGGSLQEYLSGMQKMSEEFSSENIDYKNPYSQEHCGIYDKQKNKDGLVGCVDNLRLTH